MKTIPQKYVAHWPLILVLVIYLLINKSLITMTGIAAGADGLTLFYPSEHLFKEALSAGSLPHWTTKLQTGFPLLADGQPSVLYPLNLLFLKIFPLHVAHNLNIVIHGLIAIFFTYLWGRKLKISSHASALMSLIFVLTTPLLGSNIPMLQALAWIPALFYISERSLQMNSPATLWPLSLILGLQWLAGFPQIAFYSLILISVYFFVYVARKPITWTQKFRWYLVWIPVCFIGILFATPLLLPTYKLSLFSIRANGISGSMAGEKSLFPLALSTFILPTIQSFWGRSGFGSGAYIASIPFIVALGAFFRKEKPSWFVPMLMTCFVAIIFSFGRFSPFFPIIRELPGLSSFRVPSRFLFFVQFGLITFFAWNWDQMFTPKQSTAIQWQERLFKIAILIFVLTALIGYPLLIWLKPHLLTLASEITFNYIIKDGYHLQSESYYLVKIESLYQSILNATWAGAKTIVPFISLLIGWLSIRFVRKGTLKPKFAYSILAVLICLDLFVYIDGFTKTASLNLVTDEPTTAQLINKTTNSELCRVYSLTDEKAILFEERLLPLLPTNYNSLWGVSGTGIYSPLGFHNYYRLTENINGVNLAFGLKPISGVEVEEHRDLLNYLNVCFILSREELVGFELLEKFDDVYVYHNQTSLPRVFAVDEVMVLSENEEVITAVLANTNTLSTTSFLEESILEDLTSGAAQSAKVTIREYQDTAVILDVVSEGTILLQITDTNYPEWQAFLDDQPVEILTINGLFRGIIVPQGKHEVTFSYVPTAFYNGLILAGITLIFFLIWLGIWWYKKRRIDEN